jgi:predicted CXXCH cytochrome family protein
MKARVGLKLIIIVFAAFFIAASAYGVEVSIGPADITLQTEAARKPSAFPHRQHQDSYACTACHHAKDEVMVIDKCASCHNKEISNPDVNSYKKAAHKLCKDCHKVVNKEGSEAPIKCSGCHVKKE